MMMMVLLLDKPTSMMTMQTVRHKEATAVVGGTYSNEKLDLHANTWVYTDISQDWKKSKFAKEKAKKLLTGLNNAAATNDAEEGLSMAEITKALKKPVWEAAYENAQLTKDRYLAYSYWTHTITLLGLVSGLTRTCTFPH